MIKFRRLIYICAVMLVSVFTGGSGASATGIPAGTLYRIGVDTTGIVQITSDQLASMGFDDAGRVAVYGYGGVAGMRHDFNDSRLSGIPEVPTMLTDDGRILFYAEGPETADVYSPTGSYLYARPVVNTSDTHGCYFVGSCENPVRVGGLPVTEPVNIHTFHWSFGIYHPMVSNPARSGTSFLGHDFSKSSGRRLEIEFPVPDLTDRGKLALRAVGAIKAEKPVFGIKVCDKESTLRAISMQNEYNAVETYFVAADRLEIPIAAPVTGDRTVSFRADLNNAGAVAFAAFETVSLGYTRDNVMPADVSELSMYMYDIADSDALRLEAGAETVVWDVTSPFLPRRLGSKSDGRDLIVSLPGEVNGTAHFVAFNPAMEHRPVTIEGPVSGMGRLSSMSVPDMVILTAPALRAEAERLADIHTRCQGMKIAVVEPREVFDEFGSGVRSPYAIRRFMKSLYDRAAGSPLSLLIMGASTYDPAGHVTGTAVDDTHVITYEVESLFKQGYASTCYCTDAFFGFLEDEPLPDDIVSAHMSVNVGRIPAVTQAQAAAYIDKAESYLMAPPTTDVRSRALVVCDYGDRQGHLEQAVELCDSIERRWAPAVTVTKGMSGLYQRAAGNRRPLFDKVKETLDCGIGYMAYLGMAMAREYFTLSGSRSIGDIFRMARNAVIGLHSSSEVSVNTACYNFVGDPALPVYPYTHGISVSVPDGFIVTPLSSDVIEGDVVGADGNLSPEFDGSVVIDLYEPARTDQSIYDPADGGKPRTVTRRETLVTTVSGKVKDGHFEVPLLCPEVVSPGGGHVIAVHAFSDDFSMRAMAVADDISVAGISADPSADVMEPPVIDGLWINSTTFADGDVVGPVIEILGYVIPSASGLSMTRTIGRTTTLSVDGTNHSDVAARMVPLDDGRYSLRYPLSGLPDGAHTVTLTVCDNAGNRASRSVGFTVINSCGGVTMEADRKVASDEVTFSIDHSLPDIPVGRIVIGNEKGETVFGCPDVSFPFIWNLTDSDGRPVSDGRYTVRAYLRSGLRHMVTSPLQVIVIR